MSVALRKVDGDIFIDPETGRAEVVTGPNKVLQEMFSCYTTVYDVDRDWGSNLDVKNIKVNSFAEFRARMFDEVATANETILRKQAKDLNLDFEAEAIQSFPTLDVIIDPENAAGVFISVAKVGEEGTEVGQTLIFNMKPLGIRHVLPPQFASGLTFFK